MKHLHDLLQFKKFEQYTVVSPDSEFVDWQFDISMWFSEHYQCATQNFYSIQSRILRSYWVIPWNYQRPIQMFYGA